MLIQTPVFMALFFFVPNAIELRQQSFLWASDLSAYDDLISWSTHIPLLGNHLSLFCLLFSVTTVLNQIIMMKQQDMGNNPQMAAMKWMMYIMPVMFFFIFNEYASGLSYYYFISGLIGIITMWIMRRMTDEKKLLAQLEANKKAPSERKTSGLMAKLEALQKEQERLQKDKSFCIQIYESCFWSYSFSFIFTGRKQPDRWTGYCSTDVCMCRNCDCK